MERLRIKIYNKHVYADQIKYTKLSLLICFVGVALLMVVDYFIYNQSNLSFYIHGGLLIDFSLALLVIQLTKNRITLHRLVFFSSFVIASCLQGYLVAYAWNINLDNFLYEHNLLVMQLIGFVLFATIIRDLLAELYLLAITAYLASSIFLTSSDCLFNFYSFTVLLIGIGFAVANLYYMKARLEQFESKMQLTKQLAELNSEMEKRQDLQYRLREMATYDGLTNLYTRGAGLGILRRNLEEANAKFKSLTICYIDMNNLKELNDKFGHKIGDAYIIGLVDILNEYTRKNDYVIRLGGDEFLLVLPDCTFFEAERIWRDISSAIDEFSHVGTEVDFQLGVSHGVVEYVDGNYKSIDAMLDAADALMYVEKIASKRKVNYK